MVKRRKKRSPRFSVDAVEVITCRGSTKAKAMLRKQANEQKIPLAIHVKRIIYRHLGLIEGENDAT
jgi:hypothetical protein